MINEVDPRTRGEQSDGSVNPDFVELRFTAGESNADGLSLIPFSADSAASYSNWNLNGFAPSSGRLLIGTYGTPNANLILERIVATDPTADPLRPGVDAILLSSVSYAVGTHISLVTASSIVDALVYKPTPIGFTPGSNAALLQSTLLNSGQSAVTEGANFLSNPSAVFDDSMSRNAANPGNARETTTYQMGPPTPGMANDTSVGRLRLQLWDESGAVAKTALTEGASDRIRARLSRTDANKNPVTTGTVNATLLNMDKGEVRLQDNGGAELNSISIPAGAASVDFFVVSKNDLWKDGTANAYFAATAAGYSPASAKVTVADQASDADAPVVISEVHGHIFGDANGEGGATADDQFVELYNRSNAPVNLQGWKLIIGGQVRFTFPVCSQLLPQSSAVVFGNISEDKQGITSSFGTAMVFGVGAAGLGIDEHGDTVSLADAAGDERSGFIYWPYVGGSGNLSLASLANSTATVVPETIGHKFISGSNGAFFSPGIRLDGVPYKTITKSLTLAFNQACVAELSPLGSATLTVQLPAGESAPATAPTLPLDICLKDLNGSVATLTQTTTSIGTSASASAAIPLNQSKSLAADATAKFKIVRAAGYLNSESPTLQYVAAQTEVDPRTDVAVSSTATTLVSSAGDSAAALTLRFTPALAAGMSVKVVTPSPGILFGGHLSEVMVPHGTSSFSIGLDSIEGGAAAVVIEGIAAAPDCRNFSKSFTVEPNGGLSAGPFFNEIDATPAAGRAEFLEVIVPGNAVRTLQGYVLVIFDALKNKVSSKLFGPGDQTDANGHYVIASDGQLVTGAPAVRPGAFTLPENGAAALYKSNTDVTALTGDRILDAVVWGSVDAELRQKLTPKVVAGVNQGEAAVSTPSDDVHMSLARPLVPSVVGDLRQPSKWSGAPIPTPGYRNVDSGLIVTEVSTGNGRFVELLNNGPSVLDIEGWQLNVGGATSHTFPVCSQVLPGSAVVIFGDVDAAKEGITPDFGTALVYKASGILNPTGSDLAIVLHPTAGADVTATALSLGAASPTPGTKTDSSPYKSVTQSLGFNFSNSGVAECSPANVETLTLTRPTGGEAYPVKVCLSDIDPDVATLTLSAPKVVTIAAPGLSSSAVPIAHLPVAADRTASFSVIRAAGYLNNASAPFTVKATVDASPSLTASKIAPTAGGTASVVSFDLGSTPLAGALTLTAAPSVTLGTAVIPAGSSGVWDVAVNAVPSGAAGPVTLMACPAQPELRSFQASLEVMAAGPIGVGPFFNEFDPSASAQLPEFAELYVPTPIASLNGYSVVVFDSAGAKLQVFPLAALDATNAAGYFTLSPKNKGGFDLPPDGALALYQGAGPAGAAATGDALLDAVVWGSVSPHVRRVLLPKVVDHTNTADFALTASGDSLKSLVRASLPTGSGNFRNSANWIAADYPTPGMATTARPFTAWLSFAANGGAALDDPDKDGLNNLFEFAFGTSPLDQPPVTGAGAYGAPAINIVKDGGNARIDVKALSSLAVAEGAHLVVTLQTNADLTSTPGWTPLPWTVAPGAAATQGAWSGPIPTTPDAQRYFRLKVDYVP